jgi:protease I
MTRGHKSASKSARLTSRRIAVLAADGFEKVELTIPVTALKAAGASVDIVSLHRGRIRGVKVHKPATRVRVTRTVTDAKVADYDGLLVPGGFINPDLLRQSALARDFVRAFDEARKPIATLEHGPWVLASAGLLEGRTLTSWPGIRDDVVHAGGTWLNQPVVRDRNLVTSRGPQDIVPFVRAIVPHFAGQAPMRSTASRPDTSAPQPNAPPLAVFTAMKWAPRLSVGTAVGMGLIALGLIAANARPVDTSLSQTPRLTSPPDSPRRENRE